MTTPKSKKRKLFKLLAPQAESVYLAASFNDWDPQARPIEKRRQGPVENFGHVAARQARIPLCGRWRMAR